MFYCFVVMVFFSGMESIEIVLKSLKTQLHAKVLAKLFSRATKNDLIYLTVYRIFYRKLNQKLLKEGKE